MKYPLFCFMLCIAAYHSQAQTYNRNIRFKTFGADSVNLTMNDQYYLIEDSCAQIIRYAHFRMNERKFFGKVKDVSKLNPELIVSEYSYTSEGLKDGPFIARYLNGNLRAEGNFKNDSYDGKWKMYFDNGKPELTFEVNNGDYQITDEWNPDGTKKVDNGNGAYIVNIGRFYWTGKLVGGKPDGTWKLINSDDVTKIPIEKEYFKKGRFHDGVDGVNLSYTDASRIILVDPDKLPFGNADKLLISPFPCNTKQHHIVYAQYANGMASFSDAISRAVGPYMTRIASQTTTDKSFTFEGEISEKGAITNLKTTLHQEIIVTDLMFKLESLPLLNPATIDDKPVKQKFTITFNIYEGIYKFNYIFLPVGEETGKAR